MRLLPVPRTAVRRAQMGDDLLECLQRRPFAERRYKQYREQTDPFIAINFKKSQVFHDLIFRPRIVNQFHRMLIGIDRGQR